MSYCETDTQLLLNLIKKGTSPAGCVAYCMELLEENGFNHLELDGKWDLEPGKNYVCSVYGTTCIAFRIPADYKPGMPLHLAAAHTDWPGPRIKTLPELTSGRYEKLNIEIYGGALYYSWLDRPLSIAGNVCIEDDSCKEGFRNVIIDFKRPMAVIPSLAIHYNREANSDLSLNAQTDMTPLMDVAMPGWKQDGYFTRLLSEELQTEPEKILSWDLNFYNMDEPVLFGEHTELLSAPRLDNLTSVAACISGIMNPVDDSHFSAIMLFNNEEIGSNTKQGADSVITASLIETIILHLGGRRVDYLNSTINGFMLSCDVAHAIHPNRPQLNDPTNVVYMGDGVAFKMTATQRYATDVEGLAASKKMCRDHNIPYRAFYNRADIKGGSTLGSKLSAALGIRTVDIGTAILAMHSARELMATSDQEALASLLKCFM